MDVDREPRRFLPAPRLAIRRQIRAADVCSASCTSAQLPPRPLAFRLGVWLQRSPKKGHAGSVSGGRSELSELLPHPPGAVTPDVALRSALFSPVLRSTRRQQAERRAVRRYVRALQRCMPGTDGRIPGFTCQHKTKCILLKKKRRQIIKKRK